MARKILNRKELREEAEAVQRKEGGEELEVEEQPAAPAEVAEEKAAPKKAVRRKSRTKANKEVRLKAFWGVFSQSLNQVAQFEYNQHDDAAKKAVELSDSRKSPHFVQLVKKVIEE